MESTNNLNFENREKEFYLHLLMSDLSLITDRKVESMGLKRAINGK